MKRIELLSSGVVILALCACASDTLTTPAQTLTSSPRYDIGTATSQVICANAANTTGAFNVGLNGAWRALLGFSGAGWIGPQLNSHDPLVLVPIGEYAFLTTFSVTNGESLSGRILADNGATVYLNNAPIATLGAVDASTTPSYDAMQIPTNFSANSGFVPGSNILKVVVYNAWPAGPSGASYCFTVIGATNSSPAASVAGPYSGTEGSPVSLSLSGSDVNAGDVLAYDWDLGDGTTGSGSATPTSHTYSDNGAYTITITVNDGAGGTDTKATVATITNVAPALGTITASTSLLPVGTSVGVSALVSDAGSVDTHAAVIDWKDGNSSTVSADAGAIGGNHTYTAAGVYPIAITATDNDGAISNTASYEYIVVYDPSAGFVSGAGWIVSPAGGYQDNSGLTGRGTFGFVSKYQKGATAPTGNTEFQFHTAGLSFKSTSYQWLVIAGAKAQYKGDGTINGVSGYSFLIFATDGQASGGGGVDKFRIKITDVGDNIIYDNQPGAGEADGATAALGGGNIIIHGK